jgi:hypothetical protein
MSLNMLQDNVTSSTATKGCHPFIFAFHLPAIRSIPGLVLRQGTRLVVAGLAAGLLTAVAVTRVMQNMLVEVSSTDPLTYITVSVLLAAIALGACYVPARRAMRVDPMLALRRE